MRLSPNSEIGTADFADDTDGKRFASAALEMNPAPNGWPQGFSQNGKAGLLLGNLPANLCA